MRESYDKSIVVKTRYIYKYLEGTSHISVTGEVEVYVLGPNLTTVCVAREHEAHTLRVWFESVVLWTCQVYG